MSTDVPLLGLRLAALDSAATVERIATGISVGGGGRVVTLNLNLLGLALRDRAYGGLVASADCVVADGVPLLWLCRWRGTPLPGRVAGADLLPALCRRCARDGASVYLLGGRPGHAARCAQVLRAALPTLRVAGIDCPAPGFERRPADLAALRARLRAACPDLVFVALGAPKQERIAGLLRADLPAAWWLGVGGSFAFTAGLLPRAPRLLQFAGLEWLFRLGVEPRRLYRRYVVEDGPLFLRLAARAIAGRIAGSRSARMLDPVYRTPT